MCVFLCVCVCVCVSQWKNVTGRCKRKNLRSIVTSKTDQHNSDLPHLAVCLELHFSLDRLDDISFNDCGLITAKTMIQLDRFDRV